MKKSIEEKGNMIYVYHDKFCVVKPKNHNPMLPVACPVCDFILSDSDDDIAYKENNCCLDCTRRWVQPNREKWNSGWRPSSSQIKKQQKEKHSMPISFYLENT